MFLQPCFINYCTDELIEYLISLGYRKHHDSTFKGNYISTTKEGEILSLRPPFEMNPKLFDEYIDCFENKQLFKALAALKDNDDKMQWFITENGFEFCNDNVFIGTIYHKATSFELLKNFGNEINHITYLANNTDLFEFIDKNVDKFDDLFDEKLIELLTNYVLKLFDSKISNFSLKTKFEKYYIESLICEILRAHY